jgi:hypothetical protein
MGSDEAKTGDVSNANDLQGQARSAEINEGVSPVPKYSICVKDDVTVDGHDIGGEG